MEDNNQSTPPVSPVTPETQTLPLDSTLSFGDWLQKHRVSRRISLEEIAAVTKVHIMQLKALEENEVSKLPAPAFVRGFLVSYARHLGIDENEVLERYKAAFGGSLTPIADILTPSQNRSARSASAPKVAMVSSPHLKQAPGSKEIEDNQSSGFSFRNFAIGTAIVGIVLLVGVLLVLGKKSKEENNNLPLQSNLETPATAPTSSNVLPEPSVSTPVSIAPVASPTTVPSPTSNVASTAASTAASTVAPTVAVATSPQTVGQKKYQLEIKATDTNYVHLRLDDANPKGISLKAFQTQSFDVEKKAILTISDAGNLEIKWNGTWYSTLGYRGEVKVFTLPDQLSNLVVKAAPKPRPKAPVAAPAPVDANPAAGEESAPKNPNEARAPVDPR